MSGVWLCVPCVHVGVAALGSGTFGGPSSAVVYRGPGVPLVSLCGQLERCGLLCYCVSGWVAVWLAAQLCTRVGGVSPCVLPLVYVHVCEREGESQPPKATTNSSGLPNFWTRDPFVLRAEEGAGVPFL